MLSPFQFQQTAQLLQETADSFVLQIQSGSNQGPMTLSKNLLAPELQTLLRQGHSIVLTWQPTEVATQDRDQVMKKLLEELMR
jgi:hypothetical protein